MTSADTHRLLRKAARACGVATSYRNFESKQVDISDASLIRLINALHDEPVLSDPPRADQVQDLIGKIRMRKIACGLPPVIVAWDGAFPDIWMWLGAHATEIKITLQPEDGSEPIAWTQKVSAGTTVQRSTLR